MLKLWDLKQYFNCKILRKMFKLKRFFFVCLFKVRVCFDGLHIRLHLCWITFIVHCKFSVWTELSKQVKYFSIHIYVIYVRFIHSPVVKNVCLLLGNLEAAWFLNIWSVTACIFKWMRAFCGDIFLRIKA